MENSRIPGELKVGRSGDVAARQRDLQGCQNFTVVVHAVFPKAGRLERAVHEQLADFRVQGAPGTEWFKASLRKVVKAVLAAKESAALE